MLRQLVSLTLLLLATVFAGCVLPATQLQRSVAKTHSASHRSAHFELRYRPHTVPETELVRLIELLERKLARISALLELEIKPSDQYTVFLFQDGDEMRRETGSGKEVGGFAWGTSCYVAVNNDRPLIHELVHLIARAKISYRANNFAAEGLANAIPEFPDGPDPDAVVKFYWEESIVLPLSQLAVASRIADIQIPDRQLDTYAIAWSWIRFLYENYGPEKLKRYYRGASPDKVFDKSLAELEGAWLAQIERYELSPIERTFLNSRDGKLKGTLIAGDPFHFVVSAPPFSPEAQITWTKDGNPLPNTKGLELDFSHVTAADAGTYHLTIEDPEKGEARAEIEIEVLTPADLPPVRPLRSSLR